MNFTYTFRSVSCEKEILTLEKFLREQSLGYPNYQDWITRTRVELFDGTKSAILAFSENALVGDLVFQSHKQLPRVLELKNLRVHKKLRNHYFGVFMLKQVEKNTQNYDAILADTREDKIEVINTLRFMGYTEIARAPIYDSNQVDVVMQKTFDVTESGLAVPKNVA